MGGFMVKQQANPSNPKAYVYAILVWVSSWASFSVPSGSGEGQTESAWRTEKKQPFFGGKLFHELLV